MRIAARGRATSALPYDGVGIHPLFAHGFDEDVLELLHVGL